MYVSHIRILGYATHLFVEGMKRKRSRNITGMYIFNWGHVVMDHPSREELKTTVDDDKRQQARTKTCTLGDRKVEWSKVRRWPPSDHRAWDTDEPRVKVVCHITIFIQCIKIISFLFVCLFFFLNSFPSFSYKLSAKLRIRWQCLLQSWTTPPTKKAFFSGYYNKLFQIVRLQFWCSGEYSHHFIDSNWWYQLDLFKNYSNLIGPFVPLTKNKQHPQKKQRKKPSQEKLHKKCEY